jgi:hypothetical protein
MKGWSLSSFLQGLAAMGGIIFFITGISSIPEVRRFLFENRVALYDDFDNPKYDGSYSQQLWEYSGVPGVELWQDNGVLILDISGQQNEGNAALSATNVVNSLTEVQANMRLESERRGEGGFIKLQATYGDEASWSWIECQIGNNVYINATFSCNYTDKANWQEYMYICETETIFVPYDSWNVVKFSLNSSQGTIRFFLNDKYIGNCQITNPSDFGDPSAYLQIGTWASTTDRLIGYFDEVRLGN